VELNNNFIRGLGQMLRWISTEWKSGGVRAVCKKERWEHKTEKAKQCDAPAATRGGTAGDLRITSKKGVE